MRMLAIAVLAASVSVIACNRADTTAPVTPATAAAPASNDTAAASPTTPAAAAGKTAQAESSRPAPAVREVTIPAGTNLPIVLDSSIGSDTSRVEEPVHAHLARDVVVNGQTALAEGSRVSGVVTSAMRSGKVKGRAHVAVRFDSLTPKGADDRYRIATTPVARTAASTKKKDALEIGAPALGGALIGAIVGGKKGALVGTAAGGGAGTAVVLSTRGKEVRLPSGARLTLRLTEPVSVKVVGN